MKYRVHFEASAAVGIEYEVEADDKDQATAIAEKAFSGLNAELGGQMDRLVANLMDPPTAALQGWNQGIKENGELIFPVTHATVSIDDSGFEIVDTFNAEDN